jgi:L-ascorbate metabolism protein UlaG (beta-lactamase superfamily)
MKITYYGHSCFSVLAGGKHLLFDPFITGNELAKDINIDEINADYIFVSHGHFDHMLDVVAIANRTGAMVVGIWELYDYFSKQGVKNVHPLNPGGKVAFDFGTAKAVIAQHSSSLPDGSYAGVASGFVIKTTDGNFYYSGDTGLTLDMTLIPKWADINFAVFPIGDALTMGVEDAIEAAQFVKTTQIIGVHYDTFGFIKIDKTKAIQEFKDAGLTLYLPEIGGSVEISKIFLNL